MFTLKIETDNDAFFPDPRPEVARILKLAASQVMQGDPEMEDRRVYDINGNKIGYWELDHE